MISVVMPLYNAQEYLRQSIESILGQTFKRFELIIVDDGSTDTTREIVEHYADRDDRIRSVETPHGGISRACNAGIAAARFGWIARMDGDDIALPRRFERQMEMARAEPEVVVWGTDGQRITPNGRRVAPFRVGPTSVEACKRMRERGEIVQAIHPTVVFRKDVALEVGGYDPTFDGAEDLEFFDRMLEEGPLVTIPESHLLYRVHGRSHSMRTYLHQRFLASFVAARQRRRLEGGPPLTLEAFTEHERSSRWVRFHQKRRALSALQYRQAGIAFGDRAFGKAAAHFAAATACDLRYPIRRLFEQGRAKRLDPKS